MLHVRSFSLGLITFITLSTSASNTYSLQEATEKKLVDATMYGLVGGGHEEQSVHLDLKSNAKSTLTIRLEAGQLFYPYEDNVQPLMLVKEEVIVLEPGKKAKQVLYAYCVEQSAAGPGIRDTFSIGPLADGALLEMAKFLNEKSYFGPGIQDAVWSISDGESVESIYVKDMQLSNELRQKVADLTGQQYVPLSRETFRMEQPEVIRTVRTLVEPYKLFSGYVEAYSPSGTELRVTLTDANGQELRELFKGSTGYSSGKLKYPFELDGRTLEHKMYYVRYYIAGMKVRDIPVNNTL
jgi:hypothetical protein